jgi:hypothetical protein
MMKHDRTTRWPKRLSFALTVLGLVAGWWIVLPQLSEIPLIHEHIEAMRRQGINPSAIYYSDHPGHRDWERRIQDRIIRNQQAFWP